MTTEAQPTIEPPWMARARLELGTRERLPDGKPNPRIHEYFRATSFKGGTAADPWCSAFANWVMYPFNPIGTGKANARSWLDWGVPLATPQVGCIAVYWRGDPNGAQGHVGFLTARQSPKYDLVLGGNEGNAVAIKPYSVSRLIAYRMPA
jgi:uncharacterized protein (TIGR02594 family)